MDAKSQPDDKELLKLRRALARAEERLLDYEQLVDRTQHMLNTRIDELEQARTELRSQQNELEESERRFRQLTEAAFESIFIHDQGLILDCNDAAVELYRRAKAELIGAPLDDLSAESERETLSAQIDAAGDAPLEMMHRRPDGSTFPVEMRSKPIDFHGHSATVTAVRDITEHKTLQARLEKLASTDPLTGASNRRAFMEAGKREYYRCLRYGEQLAVMMIDADHFKRINDGYGHEVGDRALCALAEICGKALRGSDIFARLGGEEFAALLPTTGEAGALELAARLRQRIAGHRIDTGNGALNFTVSIGVAVMAPGDEGLDKVLNRADKALYRAKENGRNRVESWR